MNIILSKTISYQNNNLIGLHNLNLSDKSSETLGLLNGSRKLQTLGVYTGGIGLEYRQQPTGIYGVAITFQPAIEKNSLRSISLNLSFDNISGHPFATTGIFSVENNPAGYDYDYFSFDPINNIVPVDTTTTSLSSLSSASISLTPLLSGFIYNSSWTRNKFVAIAIEPKNILPGARDFTVDSINITYYASKPSEPINLKASGSDASAYLSWNAPLDNGGDAVVGYLIQYADITNGFSKWLTNSDYASTTGLFVNNLINDNEYIFRVAAFNRVGTGIFSLESNSVIPEKPRVVTPLNFNNANYTRIRLRRDLSSNWSGINPVLALGEPGYETDTKRLKIGDNFSEWNDLDYLKVDNKSIDFPTPEPVYIVVGDSPINENNPRVICNLTNNEKLNLVGGNGINLTYNNNFKAVTFNLDQVFTPFNSGTIYSPSANGRPGTVYYDDKYMYFCVATNTWKRTLLSQSVWFAIDNIEISNTSGIYPSLTSISLSGNNLIITSDGDPYPAKASRNLTNHGEILRSDFYNNYEIADQDYNFIFRYRGGSNTSSPQTAINSINGIFNNGVIFSHCSAGNEPISVYNPPSGFNFNRIFFGSFFQLDDCGGYVNFNRQYIYQHGGFARVCWNDPKVYNSNLYYSSSNYNGDYFRHSNGHSKILGFCFDGYPIYGPFGYTNSETPTEGIALMTSSYITKTSDDHRPDGWKFTNSIVVNDISYGLSAGAFIQDFMYSEGSGLLDQYNGRFAVTPEYPEGTYAYYLTFTNSGLLIPQYPYIVGDYTKQIISQQVPGVSLNPLTVDGYYPLFTQPSPAVQYGILNGGDGGYTAYTIFGQQYYMPNGVLQKTPSTPTNITISEYRISEKATDDSVVGTFNTTDVNTDDIFIYTFASGSNDTNNNNFNIVNNELRLNTILSHDIKNIYNIRIRSTDQTNRFTEKPFDISVLPAKEFISLSITSGIDSLVAGNTHSFGSLVSTTATDLEYLWTIAGTPYASGYSVTGTTLNLLTTNVNNRLDETVNISLVVKSLSAFTMLSTSTSFVLDHSETAKCINGYYPLYQSRYDADRYQGGNGTSHQIILSGVAYWQPNGLVSLNYGNFNCNNI